MKHNQPTQDEKWGDEAADLYCIISPYDAYNVFSLSILVSPAQVQSMILQIVNKK